jgi:hypothetical protein
VTLTTTYDSAISRVQIACDALGDTADFALVERSTDGVRWTTVRGGAEAATSSGSLDATLDDYEFPPNELITYRLKSYNDTDYPQDTQLTGLVVDGTSGGYASVPDAASLDIVGDLELRVELSAQDWTPAADQTLIGKWLASGNQRSYKLKLEDTGVLSLLFSTNGTAVTTKSSTAAPTIPASGRIALKVTIDVDNGAAGYDVKFYTASSIDGVYTQLGTTVTTATATSIFSSSAKLNVGSSDDGTTELFTGVIHAARVYSGIAGTVAANPDFEAQDNADTSFVDTAAVPKTWTINGTAEIVVEQTDTITPTLTEVWLKSIIRPFLNTTVRVVGFDPVVRPARNTLFQVIGRSYPVAVTDVRGSRQFSLTVRTSTREDAENFELILASGDPIFLHSPPDTDHLWLPTTLYAVIGDVKGPIRLGTKDSIEADFELPLTEVAAPASNIVGLAVNWQIVINDYATWQELIDAQTDWSDTLEIVGSGSDVIVP